jgi:xylulokinase
MPAPPWLPWVMAPDRIILGIDIGTSSAKVLACDSELRILASASEAYQPDRPSPGYSQQEARVWWKAAATACRRVMSEPAVQGCNVVAIGTTGQMHGAVCFGPGASADGTADPVYPVMLWNDQRAAPQCGYIEKAAGGAANLVRTVGLAARAGFTLPKLLWLREQEPRVWERVIRFCVPKDYINYRLCGVIATDEGEASGTGMFNVSTRVWSSEVREWFSIPSEIYPVVHPSTAVIGELLPTAAREMGVTFRPGIAVVAGSGDNQCGMIGAGVVNPGDTAVILGTSGVLATLMDSPRLDTADERAPGSLHTFAAWPGRWCLTGCTLAAGDALAFARGLLAPDITYEDVLLRCEAVPLGCNGLMFLPHISGERCPYPSAAARGAWVGLAHNHTREHMLRSVLEGVSLTFGHIAGIAAGTGINITTARACGGGHANPLWRQLQADAMNITLLTYPESDESHMTAQGAAVLAAVGAGILKNVEESSSRRADMSKVPLRTEPRSEYSDQWKLLRARHAQAFACLSPWFESGAISPRVQHHTPT